MRKLSICVLIVSALSSAAFGSTLYDAAADYSSVKNPNGVWIYGHGGTPPFFGFTADDYNTAVTPTATTWADSTGTGGYQPLVGHNSDSSATIGGLYVPSTELFMHPGNDQSLPASLAFTAPYAGTFVGSGYFRRTDPTVSGDGVVVSVYDGLTPVFGAQLQPYDYGTYYNFAFTLNLVAGEHVFFNVDEINNYFGDTTSLELQIVGTPSGGNTNATPEPSSLILFGTGAVGMVGLVRRRFRG